MNLTTEAFNEFVMNRVDEAAKENEEYQICVSKSIELFDAIQILLGGMGKEEILFEYESALSDINRITNIIAIDVCKNMCK